MSRLLETPVGAWILDRLATDPEAAALAHDRAVEAHRWSRAATRGGRPPRGVARTLARGATLELPLWRTTPEGRVPVLAGEPLDPATLRPRALLATAMARLAACDGFVHGLGGGVYDEAMEGWIRGWLGPEHADALAPATSPARRAAFQTLRRAIDDARRSNAGELTAAAAVVRTQAGRRAAMTISTDRTWAFPLHDTGDLDDLSSSIRGAFG